MEKCTFAVRNKRLNSKTKRHKRRVIKYSEHMCYQLCSTKTNISKWAISFLNMQQNLIILDFNHIKSLITALDVLLKVCALGLK